MLERFLEQVRFDAFDSANDAQDGDLRLTALLQEVLNRLEEAGVVADAHIAFYRREARNMRAEVHAYSADSEDDVLTLFYFIDGNQNDAFGSSWKPAPVAKDAVDRGFRRLEAFARLVEAGRADDVEESQPAAELVSLLKECQRLRCDVALTVITTGLLSERAVAREDGADYQDTWDLLRLARVCGGGGDEPISIDFEKEFDCTLPCLTTAAAPDGLRVLLTSVPGPVVSRIYSTYRSRLLERNVRSFLQFTGKVNRGIRETILTTPSRFLPYNNGIAATAAEVVLEDVGEGLARIRGVRDFQIVNGGQTTASLAAAFRRDRADLSAVSVAMKLTIVPEGAIDQLVPLIAKYANLQNRIQEADFSANHPWHVALERVSRETWTPPREGAPRGTRWFYERSRGQYADELSAANTTAARKHYRIENPAAQKFTKTDLAKFVLTWDQRPAVVSRGAQKAFHAFMTQLAALGRPGPEKSDFQRIVVQALLFHTAEKLYGQLGFTGYRAQVVTYSVARLSHATQRRLPWDVIWQSQEVPTALTSSLKVLLIGVRDVVVNPPGGRNVTEWSKQDECWAKGLEAEFDLQLPDMSSWEPYGMFETFLSMKPRASGPLLDALLAVPSDVWFSISAWAKDRGELQPWQRGIAYSLGKLLAMRKLPSDKQAAQGRKLLLDAVDAGFLHTDLTVDRLKAIGDAGSTVP